MSARKQRRLAEEQRRSEEAVAKQYVDEQHRQMKNVTTVEENDGLFKAPKVKVAESVEEKALRKEQVRYFYLFIQSI